MKFLKWVLSSVLLFCWLGASVASGVQEASSWYSRNSVTSFINGFAGTFVGILCVALMCLLALGVIGDLVCQKSKP